jgi:mannosyltransferase
MRRLAAAIVALALALGATLRFTDLGAFELSPDEGASWGAASAPSLSAVIARQALLNPGKLAVHDLVLHAWIGLFGASVSAMRSLSALLSTISILLAYFVARELLIDSGDSERAPPSDDAAMLIAATTALIFAVSLVVVKYSREARMYPLMLAAILAQVTLFLRGLRRGGITNLIGVAIFTALAIATHFSAILIPATEGIWLLYVLAHSGFVPAGRTSRRAWAIGIAVAAGGLALAPRVWAGYRMTAAVVPGGVVRWIKPPEWYAPLALFNKATGSIAFPVLALLAAVGAVRGWRRNPDAVAFALVWMWAPPLMMLAASYLLTPIFIERYALSCFVPFFILAALGIFELPREWARAGALAIVVALALGHDYEYYRRPHDAQFREAVMLADAQLKPGESITVVPNYAIEVLRYYLPAGDEGRAVAFASDHKSAAIVILREQGDAPATVIAVRREYPHLIATVRGLEVRGRDWRNTR